MRKISALSRPARLALAVLPVIAASGLGGLVTRAAVPVWYAGLARPAFNPPNWVFGPVWTVLFAMIALSAYRILSLAPGMPGRREALWAYALQLALNTAWSFAFFGLQSTLAGLVVIVPLLAAILLTIRLFWPLDRVAAWLLVPYAAWVSYATVLNAALWWLNG
jgi:tryptophan-rich sensory protein